MSIAVTVWISVGDLKISDPFFKGCPYDHCALVRPYFKFERYLIIAQFFSAADSQM